MPEALISILVSTSTHYFIKQSINTSTVEVRRNTINMATNGILPTTAICCNGLANAVINATCCLTCCDDAEDASPTQANDVVLGVIAFSLVLSVLCLLLVVNNRVRGTREKLALQAQAKKKVASQERKRKRKESISKGLIVKEWVPDDAPVVASTEGDQDNPAPAGEALKVLQPLSQPIESSSPASCAMGSDDCCDDENTPTSGKAVEAPQPPAASPINSSSFASCAIGSDDCESIDGEEEMAGCAICLSPFRPQQLVCESNNSLCRHVFHKDCMVDWLLKGHDECPMCREVYLVETV
jgi:hypothetical protein